MEAEERIGRGWEERNGEGERKMGRGKRVGGKGTKTGTVRRDYWGQVRKVTGVKLRTKGRSSIKKNGRYERKGGTVSMTFKKE